MEANKERKFSNMKNRNIQLTAVLFLVALAFVPITQATPRPDGGPNHPPAMDVRTPDGGPNWLPDNEARPDPTPRGRPTPMPRPDGAPVNDDDPSSLDKLMPVISIHSTGDVSRGKTGSFVLDMKPTLWFSAMFVNFKVSGTAIPGVDYVALVSPAYVGQSGFGTILVQTLPDPRGSGNRQSYSVVITLEDGAGYAVGAPNSATMWIRPEGAVTY
jgi:hypothetical protein